MPDRPDRANSFAASDTPPAIELMVTLPGPGPRVQLMTVISLGQQRNRVVCVPVADEYRLEFGDEIELTDTAGGGHLFHAVVAKSILKIETHVLPARAARHPGGSSGRQSGRETAARRSAVAGVTKLTRYYVRSVRDMVFGASANGPSPPLAARKSRSSGSRGGRVMPVTSVRI
jgi:hypothetical protein